MIQKFISSKAVIEKVYRDRQFTEDGNWAVWIEWIGEAIELIGCFNAFQILEEEIQVKNYRASLPCNFYELIDLSFCGTPLQYLTGSFDYSHSDRGFSNSFVAGYTMNAGYLNFNFKEGKVQMAYKGIPVDEDGFPMIPDHASVREACYRYIIWKMNEPKADTGQISEAVFTRMERQWIWYCGQAGSAIKMPDLRQMAQIGKMYQSLVPHINKDKIFFSSDNIRYH